MKYVNMLNDLHFRSHLNISLTTYLRGPKNNFSGFFYFGEWTII